MPEKLPVTVVIPVKNEERNLPACLARLGRFAAVVVVDSSSTDRTKDVAVQHGAQVLNFEWDGRYPKKRNWYLLNHAPATPWVMFLDADEIIDERFVDALAEAIEDDNLDGYWLTYTNHFLGKRLMHGVEQRKLALIRTGKGLYEQIDEDAWSSLDMEVHEHPIIEGPAGRIDVRIDHRDDSGLAKFIDRHRNYALWEARRVVALRSGPAEAWEQMTKRQSSKYRNIDKWWFAWVYFAYDYIGKRGFLDGYPGFTMAFYKLWYFKTIRLLIKERTR